MRTTLIARGAAVAAAAAMVALSAAPATAATVSQASATALSLELAGTGATDTGTYAVTNDGSTESSQGVNEPVIAALGGQDAIQAGTLAQNAVAGTDATSAACSGLAGDGATLVEVGDGDCLKGGNNLKLDMTTLNFSNVEVVKSELFMGMDTELQKQARPVQQELTAALNKLLEPIIKALGNPGLYLDLGAVQSSCTANAKTANGDSSLAGAALYAVAPGGERIDLVKLPVDPAPNQKVVTDLSGVVDAILDGLRTQLEDGLAGALKPVSQGLTQAQDDVLDPLLGAIEEQLKPLEENVIDITLNAQHRTPGAISVTALNARVLPAAKPFVGGDLAHVTIGTSNCGPNSPAVKAAPHTPAKPPAAAPAADIPTVVTSGMESYDDGSTGHIALVAMLLLVAGGAGAGAYVRTLRRG